MRRRSITRHAALAVMASLLAISIGLVEESGNAHGDSGVPGTLTGEGGDAMTPVMLSLIKDDGAQLSPDIGSYTNVTLDQAIADFVGTAPGTFAADFAVSERKLTSAEAATATADGRSFAYVPFAASPVALMTLVPNANFTSGTGTITPDDFCQHIPLNLAELDGIYGSPQYSGWGDPQISCTVPTSSSTTTTSTSSPTTTSTSSPTVTTTTLVGSTSAAALPFALWGNEDPTMENSALESLLDSTTASTNSFGAELTTLKATNQVSTTSTGPSELWPYNHTEFPGGDQATVGKLIALNAISGAPSNIAAQIQLGAIMPVDAVWTGAPLGVSWNLPTAAIQNAAGDYVAPSTAAAQAAPGAPAGRLVPRRGGDGGGARRTGRRRGARPRARAC